MAKTKGTTSVSRRGKTATVWRGAWDQVHGIQTTRTSETEGGSNSKSAKKWQARRSTTGIGNPREYKSTTGRKTKYYTGGGF